MKPTVLLFDIDGTLIDTGGAGRRSMERAFERVHQRKDACAGISFGGMTDPAILRAGLQAIGQEPSAAAIEALLAAYVEALAEELRAAQCRVHAGMVAALDAGHEKGCAVGLGTGNVREGAKLKLGRVGLFERFSFGGFGCDHEVRSELIRKGAERGAEILGVPLAECRVVVIGDTPKDVAAAKAIGAESIAVATGWFSVSDLEAAGATHTFADLTDPRALGALLGG